eukprot:396014-Lingulodinium_polyedra.AAC.1
MRDGVSDPGTWREIGKELGKRKGIAPILKAESHISDEEVAEGCGNRQLTFANRLADEQANVVAVGA